MTYCVKQNFRDIFMCLYCTINILTFSNIYMYIFNKKKHIYIYVYDWRSFPLTVFFRTAKTSTKMVIDTVVIVAGIVIIADTVVIVADISSSSPIHHHRRNHRICLIIVGKMKKWNFECWSEWRKKKKKEKTKREERWK